MLFELNHYGINQYSVFPDLDSLSAYTNWHIANISYWGGKDLFSGDSEEPDTALET